MESGQDIQRNLDESLAILNNVGDSSGIVVFPEYQVYVPDFRGRVPEVPESLITEKFGPLSRGRHLYVNYPEPSGGEKPYNTSVIIHDGQIISRYRKIHLYDAGKSRESDFYAPGNTLPGNTNISGQNASMQICYDIRFPEACRNLRLSGARIITYQAGWFAGSGKLAQWQSLVRARAIENGCYVIAAAQCGERFTGHSMVVNPYGEVIEEMNNEPGILEVDIDTDLLGKYDADYPLMQQRNPASDQIDH